MSILKKPYEISLWEDRLERVIDGEEVHQYYDEKKIAIIGSDTMTAPFRAVNPSFTQNVNGSMTLSFTLYSKYYDDETDALLDNPFTKLMVNERKVKLKYDGEWFDFVIKSIQENSEQKSYTYTAKSLFVNELSKTGFELELDTELENNLGTVDELAKAILDGTDWELKTGEKFQQYKEEPLYEVTLSYPISYWEMYPEKKKEKPIPSGTKVYAFYQTINEPNGYFQFLYVEDGKYETDDNLVITNSPNYYCTYHGSSIPFIASSTISNKYRGRRLVRSAKSAYDANIDKYVAVYKDPNGAIAEDDPKKIIYGYTESKYITTGTVENYVVNPNNFTETNGWETFNISLHDGTEPTAGVPPAPEVGVDKKITQITSPEAEYTTFLQVELKSGQCLVNAAIDSNRSKINGFTQDETYYVYIEYINGSNKLDTPRISAYTIDNDGKLVEGENYFTFAAVKNTEGQYSAKCNKSISYKDMLTKKIGLIFPSTAAGTYKIVDVQLFKEVKDTNDNLILPGSAPTAETKILYKYYKPSENQNAKSVDDIVYIYVGYTPAPYAADYDSDFQKRRSITAKESNRFNLLQSLCETFECWIKFEIEHDGNGKISLDENYRQKKWVSFHEYVGKDNYAGFKYGINLKSIQRTLDSEAIANKLIVKNNSNEFADGGFCSISRADENPIKENFIYDFSYYTNQGLINFNELNNDLYIEASGYIGYYSKLRTLNKDVAANIEEQSVLVGTTIPRLESSTSNYKTNYDKSVERKTQLKRHLKSLTGYDFGYLLAHQDNSWWKDEDVKATIYTILYLQKNIAEYDKLYKSSNTALTNAKNRLTELQEKIDDITEQKKVLNARFYKKYSRFIQEGSWISEDYIDPNLYYLDAESTLHTSSQPKVSYTINVIELSQVEGYELYQFKVGDKTTMEDTEFFGWTYKNSIRTPYREEVIVSEVKFMLDSPEQDQIKVQNYKTQFEDLFQRIAATTASVQFSTGDYQRAASIVNTNGTIDASVIQNSISNNSLVLSTSNNESVMMGPEGIVTTSLTNPLEMVRIVGGGIFLSNNGGSSWNTGITGSGINADYINTGQIDTNVIRIFSGKVPTFRWDSIGLSAYRFESDSNGYPATYNPSIFVRLDQYGLYGIEGSEAFNAMVADVKDGPTGISKIKEKSKFYLTWEGFGIKTNNGSISITSDNDIQVFDEGKERIKIGFLETKTIDGKNHNIYGLRLKDDGGNTTLETGSDGQLYLQKTIKIAPSKYSTAARTILGPSEFYDKDGNTVESNSEKLSYSKIFSVIADGKETIAFYDNGKLVAKNATITGTLEAGSVIAGDTVVSGTGTTIGVIAENINTINTMKGVKIVADNGSTFVETTDGAITPKSLTFSARDNGISITDSNKVEWYISSSLAGIAAESNKKGTGKTFTLGYGADVNINTSRQYYVYIKYKHTDEKEYTAYKEVNIIKDGAPGITYRIDSSRGFSINVSDESTDETTELTARIYSGAEELDPDGDSGWFYTWYDKTDSEIDFEEPIGYGKSVSYSLSKFDKYTQIYFTVDTNINLPKLDTDGTLLVNGLTLDENGILGLSTEKLPVLEENGTLFFL